MTTNYRSACLLFCAICLFGQCYLQAQQPKCSTASKRNARLELSPVLQSKVARLEQLTSAYTSNASEFSRLRAPLSLPVVVHVLWRTEEENISEDQILSQMAVLNEDFRQLNENFQDTPEAFRSVAADIEIEFCLASTDPNGNPTNGITRTHTFTDDIGATEDWYSTYYGGKDAWDVDRYINIWVCDIGDDGTLGFAFLPGTADPPEADGLVIGHQYFGTTGTVRDAEFNNLGRTVTHEMGHYFNLEHLWGPEWGGCDEDDFVSDTPEQYEDSFACPDYPFYDDCTFEGNGIQFMNFMDYTDDECMTMFTEGQKMRIWAALNYARSGLLDSESCNLTTATGALVTNQQWLNVYPNPVSRVLALDYRGSEGDENLLFQVFNPSGQLQFSWRGEQMQSLDLSGWAPGVYFIRCPQNPAYNQRFIVQ